MARLLENKSARRLLGGGRSIPDGLHEEDDDGLLPIDATDIRTVEVATAVW